MRVGRESGSVANRWLGLLLAEGPRRRELQSQAGRELTHSSLRTSRLIGGSGSGLGFYDSHGTVGRNKSLIGDAPNVRFGDLVNAVDRAKQFAPVVVTSLI